MNLTEGPLPALIVATLLSLVQSFRIIFLKKKLRIMEGINKSFTRIRTTLEEENKNLKSIASTLSNKIKRLEEWCKQKERMKDLLITFGK